MKTTVEIADALLQAARRAATREGTTVRAIIERGLRRVLQEEASRTPFKLRKASFKGKGLQRELAGQEWGAIRDAAYKGRGA
jgi:hypothetical protein